MQGIAIAGAGVGGLVTALSLESAGRTDTTVLEAVSELRPLGVGINLLPHAVRELHELGLGDELATHGVPVDWMAYYDQHGNQICRVARGTAAGTKWPQYSLHRGNFQFMLYRRVLEVLGPDAVRTGTRLRSFELTDDGVALETVSGPSQVQEARQYAALIGADGVNSTVRATLYPGEGEACWNGCVMWRGTARLDSDFLQARTVLFAGHHDQRFMGYPIRMPDGELVLNWICTVKVDRPRAAPEDWNRQVDPAEILERYQTWRLGPISVPEVVANADAVYEYPMTDREPLPYWSVGQATLLGDAAHPMYPTGSQGSSQAILDARVLAAELTPDRPVADALAAYDERRRQATAKVVLANRQMADARVLQLVHERAPQGFGRASDVISDAEVQDINARYQRMAGFDPLELNQRKSIAAR
ncbi:MAG TPA: flavin-dependent oxidoreductase [Trebonia sp.]|jgi:2-polyprenyl-6-methoxyphenol hydroxylase-like FAD-dependent oxidoreductase